MGRDHYDDEEAVPLQTFSSDLASSSRLSAHSSSSLPRLRLPTSRDRPLLVSTFIVFVLLYTLYRTPLQDPLSPDSTQSISNSASELDDEAARHLRNLPEVFVAGGTRYPRPVPPSWPDPWPSHPHIASQFLPAHRFTPSSLSPPRQSFTITDDYLNATFPYFVRVAAESDRVWKEDGEERKRGEGFDDNGRPLKIPHKYLYKGEDEKWKPPRLEDEKELPRVQLPGIDMRSETEVKQDSERREWVRRAFLHLWESYKDAAWGHDELKPISNTATDAFSGWGATIVDTLDTLLLLGLEDEYLLAREHVASIDFSYLSPKDPSAYLSPNQAHLPPVPSLFPPKKLQLLSEDLSSPDTIPTFETVIRYLGGLLSAYDLSHDPLLLARAVDLGDWLLPSIGTQYGFVVPGYALGSNPDGDSGEPACLAEAGSLSLEFTRLSQLSGDPIYFDMISRVTDSFDNWKATKRVKGLFPINLDPRYPDDLSGRYSFGGQADSYYEYLIKEYQLLQGASSQYSRMYKEAVEAAHEHLIRPITPIIGVPDLVTIGELHFNVMLAGEATGVNLFAARLDHLTCFAGGMLGLGAKLLHRPKDLLTAQQFTSACTWAYDATRTGLAPETIQLYSVQDPDRWKAVTEDSGREVKIVRGDPPGVHSASYYHIQRPETIESVWYMYRITGDRKWQDKGWKMFTSWVETTIVEGGFTHINNVHSPSPRHDDSGVESFVYTETLKYYYLLFSPPSLLSLDEWVFTTEAHPFKIPNSKGKSERAPFWSREPLKMYEGPIGQGTQVQRWARVMQAAAGAGWAPANEGMRVPP